MWTTIHHSLLFHAVKTNFLGIQTSAFLFSCAVVLSADLCALLTVAADGHEPVQMKLHKSLKLWTFYVDLEESLGNLDSTRDVYERILDLRIATPQIIINYAMLLEV